MYSLSSLVPRPSPFVPFSYFRRMKTPADSLTVMTELVHPNHTNILGNLHGGQLLYWMDICSAIAATKHTHKTVVTASVDNVSFQNPIRLADLVTIHSKVVRCFKTSMEVHIEVFAEYRSEEHTSELQSTQ